jgi:5-formyltetrahydrofolate cyclo-ligase
MRVMNRKKLRAELRKIRQIAAIKRQSICFDFPQLLNHVVAEKMLVAGYVSNGAEPDVLPWITTLVEAGFPCALPHIESRDATMSFKRWHPVDTLVEAPFGFLQPGDDQACALPDIILTPLLSFDRQGNRIGQGAGHYDRYFASHPHAIRIGVAWSVQQVAAVPVEAWDIPLDAIVTEEETLLPPDTRIFWL